MTSRMKKDKNSHQRMMEDFKSYINQIPVLHFNSARCDLNLIKKVVAIKQGVLLLRKVILTFVYPLLNPMHFLAAGTS